MSHLYCSPYLQAAAGSTHGYDVVDHSRLNGELGGAAGYRRLVEALRRVGLTHMVDIVPNHMALAGRSNSWWWDVLENGPSSRYATYFDIDWDPPQRKLMATVLVPVLGDHYGRELERGLLNVERQLGTFVVRYADLELPLSPRTLDDLLVGAAANAGCEELRDLAVALGRLPHALLTDPESVTERHLDKERLARRLAELSDTRPQVAEAIDRAVDALNRNPDALDRLLMRQNYRLAYWRTASEELSYRRFFNIETLAALRMDRLPVFADTHRLVFDMVAEGVVQGLRIDHIDGLADPEGYLRRVREATSSTYVVVEKILGAQEHLPESWPVAGTTGYDFLDRVNQLFVDSDHETAVRSTYARFTGQEDSYADVVYTAKLEIMREELAAEIERLTGRLADVCEDHRRQRDYTRRELRDALREMIAALSVYRVYSAPRGLVRAEDRSHVDIAVAAARQRRPDIDAELLQFIGALLVLDYRGESEFAVAVQFGQVSSAVMAKGAEDTAFYRYHPLVSLNEVGGDPGRFGISPEDFHGAMVGTASHWPNTMNTLSTHDTKRSGDVRARINLLSELPQSWDRAIHRWAEHNRRHKRESSPDRNIEYLLYQTLVGAWPIDVERIRAFLVKAAREAKVHTSWTDPDPVYEESLDAFVTETLGDEAFVSDLERFLADHRLVEWAQVSSLAQTTLLLTCPGIPDVYQGTEVWDHSLVDPDNRRPVDYDRRRQLLRTFAGITPEGALARRADGGSKLWLIHRLLALRHQQPAMFDPASGYQALPVSGRKAKHALAFSRMQGLAVVVPRLVIGLSDDWDNTTVSLPEGSWINVLTDEEVDGGTARVRHLCRRFPVAVLAQGH